MVAVGCLVSFWGAWGGGAVRLRHFSFCDGYCAGLGGARSRATGCFARRALVGCFVKGVLEGGIAFCSKGDAGL